MNDIINLNDENIDLKKSLKIMLYRLQSKEIEKFILLKIDNIDNRLFELLNIIKFTGLLHCFKLIINDKNIDNNNLNYLFNNYTDLEVIFNGNGSI